MRRAQSDKVVHLASMFLEIWQSSSTNESTKTVRYNTNFTEAASRTILVDVSVDFLGQSDTHFVNVAFSVVFVC